jgi:hypothetical protein
MTFAFVYSRRQQYDRTCRGALWLCLSGSEELRVDCIRQIEAPPAKVIGNTPIRNCADCRRSINPLPRRWAREVFVIEMVDEDVRDLELQSL